MRTNVRAYNALRTHEGATAHPINAEQALRRSVLSCLLFEREFYEDGIEISERIKTLAASVKPEIVAALAVEARNVMHLRHVPLLLLEVLSRTAAGRTDALVSKTIGEVIARADEMAEFVAIYTAGGDRRTAKAGHGHQFTAQVMRGLDLALRRFDAYQLAKYDRAGKVKLRDVFRIVRPKPDNEEQAQFFKAAKDGTLPSPDTWEVALSGGAETKKEVFERLLTSDKLGYLALLRNLRNMHEAGVDRDLVNDKIALRKGAARVLPFRYVAAARAVPSFERAIDAALLAAIVELPKFGGRTALLVDVSGSMDYKLSAKSDLTRMDAAASLAAIFPGDDIRLFTFSDSVVEVPARRGMAGIDAIRSSQLHNGTYLGRAVTYLAMHVPHDRLVVITDEQSHDAVPQPQDGHAYMINVASNRNGVGYGHWTHIDGFSENVLRFMHEHEVQQA
ncbi:TROVE domain-containing protein [Bradyrhizobium sp. SRL28]|uniref:TROVE domain-containing protein n=1 Tax=Bradyrhizobium sp. SRL28 TaxID=2836178 RepID=UPI001BDE02E1|nr:TROVE domain-containing protein [Bradyrhizobium sp. SRL28]MBT1509384.1 TROVE domain-containing protein [Bradyrhizobium sp. SRL28]